MSLFPQLVYCSSAFHSKEAIGLAGLLPFKEKLLCPPAEDMESYLEVSFCWHLHFRKTQRNQCGFYCWSQLVLMIPKDVTCYMEGDVQYFPSCAQ